MEEWTESGVTWLTLPAEVSSLAGFTEFVRQGALAAGVPESELGRLELVLEEIVVNVARYGYPGDRPGTVDVGWAVTAPRRLVVYVRDRGRAYNPLAGSAPGLEKELAERPVGGLGIFLVKSLVDSASYAREGDRNVLWFRFQA